MLNFRPTQPDDLDSVFMIEHHPDNINWIFPYSLDRHNKVIEADDEFHFVFEDESGIVGFIILATTEKEHDSVEFRRIAIESKGKGYGRKAIKWIKDWAFNNMGVHRLWLDVYPDNARARKLYKSEGFQEEGMKRESIRTNSGRRSQIYMSILRHEYQES